MLPSSKQVRTPAFQVGNAGSIPAGSVIGGYANWMKQAVCKIVTPEVNIVSSNLTPPTLMKKMCHVGRVGKTPAWKAEVVRQGRQVRILCVAFTAKYASWP